MIKIWVDDERPAPEGYNIWCKSVYETIAEIAWQLARGKEVLVSLDHDAGDQFRTTGGGDYINILKFYETPEGHSYCSMQMIKLKVHFHSANPVGVKNMRAIVEHCPWMEESLEAWRCSIEKLSDKTVNNFTKQIAKFLLKTWEPSWGNNMLIYNKYLKELGYKESDFPFPFEKKDARYNLNKKYGVVEAQTWALHNTIVLELYTYLRYFQDECPEGIPGGWIDESKEDRGLSDWRNALDEMIKGLRAYWQAENLESSEYKTYEEEKAIRDELYAQFNKAWKLLGDNLRCLW